METKNEERNVKGGSPLSTGSSGKSPKPRRTCIQYLPKLKRKCLHTVEQGYWKCYQHRKSKFPKPPECPVCVSDLPGWCIPLKPCHHWVCWNCIIQSGKENCPMCRCKIEVPKKHLFMLHFYAKQLKAHLERASLDLIGSETVRNQIQEFLDELIGGIEHDAVSCSEIGEDNDSDGGPDDGFTL